MKEEKRKAENGKADLPQRRRGAEQGKSSKSKVPSSKPQTGFWFQGGRRSASVPTFKTQDEDDANMKITKRTQLSFFDLPINTGDFGVFGRVAEKNEPNFSSAEFGVRTPQRERPCHGGGIATETQSKAKAPNPKVQAPTSGEHPMNPIKCGMRNLSPKSCSVVPGRAVGGKYWRRSAGTPLRGFWGMFLRDFFGFMQFYAVFCAKKRGNHGFTRIKM
jgi:hypothetical protein